MVKLQSTGIEQRTARSSRPIYSKRGGVVEQLIGRTSMIEEIDCTRERRSYMARLADSTVVVFSESSLGLSCLECVYTRSARFM